MATIYGLSIPVFEACVLVARADFIHRFLHSWRDFGIYLGHKFQPGRST